MVWFQCEDCGENLRKPKLPNHFGRCSAYKVSPENILGPDCFYVASAVCIIAFLIERFTIFPFFLFGPALVH